VARRVGKFRHSGGADLRELAYAGTSTASWTQLTSGSSASGTLTVKEGASSVTLTLVGSYTSANFSVTSDGSGGTLVTDPPVDPPVSGGGSVDTGAGTSSDPGMADIAAASFAPVTSGSVISGGYEASASAGTAADTGSGAGTAGVFFSGGGMVALDALLAQFAGVISGFDLGDGVDLQSLGFGSSSNAASWMQATSGNETGASGLDKGGLFNLTLLGQYAANFSAGADVGGTLTTDPSSAASVIGPTSMTVAHS